jgi:hypothetical protein
MKQNERKNKDDVINICNNSWLDKLKPSNKNIIVKDKIFSKLSEANSLKIIQDEKDNNNNNNKIIKNISSIKIDIFDKDNYFNNNNCNKNEINLNGNGKIFMENIFNFNNEMTEQSIVEKKQENENNDFTEITENMGEFSLLIGKKN